jgi:hypothetical protein
VVFESCSNVRTQADIETGARTRVLEDVNEAFVASHVGAWSNQRAVEELAKMQSKPCGTSPGWELLQPLGVSLLAGNAGAGVESQKVVSPPPPLRGCGAASFAWLAEPKLTLRFYKRERRMVDQTGIEPVTS